jgi:glucosamine--fructose-6-phosphate aminotransferase (isomerizing)
VRESDLTLLTQAGREIGVASTKAFTTQLVGLLLLTLAGPGARHAGKGVEATLVEELRRLPTRLGEALAMDSTVEKIAELFADKNHTLFLGRGAQYPVAMEGAQAQGNLLHPRRSLPGRRAEARPVGAGG